MKKTVSLFLLLALLVSLLPSVATANESTQKVIAVDGAEMTLSAFAALAATDTFAGKSVLLLSDITDASEWVTVTEFRGEFNGNGKTLSGLNKPLFKVLNGAKVYDLTLKGAIGSADNRTLLSSAYGALACSVSGGSVEITNVVCAVDLYVKHVANGVGGLVGEQTGGSLLISQCKNEGRVDCVNLWANTNMVVYAGGILGRVANNGSSVELRACQNTGAVVGASTKAVESVTDADAIKNASIWCNVGGILGRVDPKTIDVAMLKCINKGYVGRADGGDDVKASVAYRSAGLIGSLRTYNAVRVADCVNYGAINAPGVVSLNSFAGGLIGEVKSPLTLECCYNYGHVTSAATAGGLIGSIGGHETTTAFNVTSCAHIAPNGHFELATRYLLGYVGQGVCTLTGNVIIGLLPTVESSGGDEDASNDELDAEPVTTGDGIVEDGVKEGASFTHTGTLRLADGEAWTGDEADLVLLGYQVKNGNQADTKSIRFVATVTDSLCKKYDSVGYQVIRSSQNSAGVLLSEGNTVYSSLVENGNLFTPEKTKASGDYFVTVTITDVPADEGVSFLVRPFLKKGDTVAYGPITAIRTGRLGEAELSEYSIVYETARDGYKTVADRLQAELKARYGILLDVYADDQRADTGKPEILVGKTNRTQSASLYTAKSPRLMNYEVVMQGKRVQLLGGGPFSVLQAVKTFVERIDDVVTDGSYFATDLAPYAPAMAQGTDVRIMTSNVLAARWGEKNDSDPNYEATLDTSARAEIYAALLVDYQPDAVGLQEACDEWEKQLTPYLTLLREEYGIEYTWLYAQNKAYNGKMVPNMTSLLYRSDKFHVLATDIQLVKYAAKRTDFHCRLFAWAKLQEKNNSENTFIIMNTHWDLNRRPNEVAVCVSEHTALINKLYSEHNVPILCTGDYNKAPTTDEFKQFLNDTSFLDMFTVAETAGTNVNRIGGCQNPGVVRVPGRGNYIDHVVGSPECNPLRFETVIGNCVNWMTDHAPMIADIQFQ